MAENEVQSSKKKLDPQNNQVQISLRKPPRHFQYLAKIFLNKFETVELHALGEATTTAVRVAENLTRSGQTTTYKIATERAFPNQDRPQAWKPKIIITLKRTAKFRFEDK